MALMSTDHSKHSKIMKELDEMLEIFAGMTEITKLRVEMFMTTDDTQHDALKRKKKLDEIYGKCNSIIDQLLERWLRIKPLLKANSLNYDTLDKQITSMRQENERLMKLLSNTLMK